MGCGKNLANIFHLAYKATVLYPVNASKISKCILGGQKDVVESALDTRLVPSLKEHRGTLTLLYSGTQNQFSALLATWFITSVL